jgi:flagellar basal body-associated protein FliL
MAKKKKGDAEGADGAPAGPKPPSTPTSMLTGAMFVLLGAMGYKFILAGTPAQTVLVSAPIDAVAGAHGATSEADCSDVAAAAATSEAPHGKSAAAESGGTVTLTDMTIKLADTDAAHYVKVGVALELGAGVVAEEFESEKAKASDVAVRYFSQKTSTQLAGSTAIETAKLELTCLMQIAYADPVEEGAKKPTTPPEPKVAHVLFTQYLMQ